MTKSIHAGVHKPQASEAISLADAAMLDKLQRTAFNYFPSSTNTQNGLVADRMRDGSPSSIAVVGLALSCYPVGVERGWIDRDQAVQYALQALRFFWRSDQTGSPEATGFRGFYFHFLDMQTGARVWQCELSIIDTALLIAGILSSAAYFTRTTPMETELRELGVRSGAHPTRLTDLRPLPHPCANAPRSITTAN